MNKIKAPISDKDKIREEVKKRISFLSEEDKNQAAHIVSAKLFEFSIVQESINIIFYEALQDELSLKYFIEQARKQKKNIITITPSGNYTDLPEEGIVLVPGRAFTLSGKRIGRGGGWYDRFLSGHPKLYTLGVCFDCQIFPELVQEEYDVLMNKVIVG